MKGLDTNILVRFLTKDDPKQAELVHKLFLSTESSNSLLFVSSIVVMETIWVLESAYELSREDVLLGIENLVGLGILKFEHENCLPRFLSEARRCKTDLSDLLMGLVDNYAGCDETITFDKKAGKSELFTLLKN